MRTDAGERSAAAVGVGTVIGRKRWLVFLAIYVFVSACRGDDRARTSTVPTASAVPVSTVPELGPLDRYRVTLDIGEDRLLVGAFDRRWLSDGGGRLDCRVDDLATGSTSMVGAVSGENHELLARLAPLEPQAAVVVIPATDDVMTSGLDLECKAAGKGLWTVDLTVRADGDLHDDCANLRTRDRCSLDRVLSDVTVEGPLGVRFGYSLWDYTGGMIFVFGDE